MFFLSKSAVLVQEATSVISAFGTTETWAALGGGDGGDWADVKQISSRARGQGSENVDGHYEVVFDSVRSYDYATVRFLWTDPDGTVRTLRPTKMGRVIPGRRTSRSVYHCLDITDRADPI